jgi:hypothetical protein
MSNRSRISTCIPKCRFERTYGFFYLSSDCGSNILSSILYLGPSNYFNPSPFSWSACIKPVSERSCACVRGNEFTSFHDIAIAFRNCFHSVVFFVFHFMARDVLSSFIFCLYSITNNTFTERLTLSGHLSSPIVFPVGPCCSSYP